MCAGWLVWYKKQYLTSQAEVASISYAVYTTLHALSITSNHFLAIVRNIASVIYCFGTEKLLSATHIQRVYRSISNQCRAKIMNKSFCARARRSRASLYSQIGKQTNAKSRKLVVFFFRYCLWNTKYFFLTIRLIFVMNKTSLEPVPPDAPFSHFDGLFLSKFNRYKIEILLQRGYHFQKFPIKCLARNLHWYLSYSVSRKIGFLLFVHPFLCITQEPSNISKICLFQMKEYHKSYGNTLVFI